jgi:hypothetical protein
MKRKKKTQPQKKRSGDGGASPPIPYLYKIFFSCTFFARRARICYDLQRISTWHNFCFRAEPAQLICRHQTQVSKIATFGVVTRADLRAFPGPTVITLCACVVGMTRRRRRASRVYLD